MHVVECDVPSSSVLGPDVIRTAYFHDSYRAPLAHPELGIVDIFFALFGHTPLWMKLLLIVRNMVAGLFGLQVSTVGEIMKPEVRCAYSVGEKIGLGRSFLLATMKLSLGETTSTWTSGCQC
jgi:hypothetical protein